MKKLLYILLFVPLALFGQENYSLSFDGEDDYVTIGVPNGMDPIESHSFIFHAKNKESACSHGNIISEIGIGNNQMLHYGFRGCDSQCPDGNCMGMDFYANNLFSESYMGSDWDVWALSYNSNTLERKIFLNGILYAQDTADAPYQGELDLLFGAGHYSNNESPGDFWHGNIDNIYLLSYPISMEQIQSFIICPETLLEHDIVSCWNFNEGSGDTVYDISGNGNHGVINGATYSEDVPENNCLIEDGIVNEVEEESNLNQIEGLLYVGSFAGSEYYFTIDNMEWQEATLLAQENGGNLTVINSQDEFNYIANNFSSFFTPSSETNGAQAGAWIGLTDYNWQNDEIGVEANYCSHYELGMQIGNNFGMLSIDDASLDNGTCIANESYNWHNVVGLIEIHQDIQDEELNYSMSFDGVDDYIHIGIPNGITPSESHTFMFYEKHLLNESCNSIGMIIGEYGYAQQSQGLHYGYRACETNCPEGACFGMDFYDNSIYTESINDLGWNQWVLTYNHQTLERTIYLNGNLMANDLSNQNPYNGPFDLIFGGNQFLDSQSSIMGAFYNGLLDDISLWSYSLSTQEINDYIICSPIGIEDGLVGYWNFNEGEGDIVYDLSGDGNHGTIYSATYSEDVPENNCVEGCIDTLAINYNDAAGIDDGSCVSVEEYTIDSLEIVNQVLLEESSVALSSMQQALDTWNTTIDLQEGWNMFGYGCPEAIDVIEGLSDHVEHIVILKDNAGSVYMPEYDFNGIGEFTSGYGYQIKVSQDIIGFSLCDWYVNDIPEDNIVSLQEENASLQAELDCYENPQIGDYCYGGIVFYVTEGEEGKYGLVATTEIVGTGTYYDAMELSDNYEYEGYDDWRLPSLDELYIIYSQIYSSGLISYITGDVYNWYWALNECEDTTSPAASDIHFTDGFIAECNNADSNPGGIIAIRSFGNVNYGCMDSLACNYNPQANMADGSCTYAEQEFNCDGLVTAQIGDEFQGGILFYIDETGGHGLISSIESLEGYMTWYLAMSSVENFESNGYDDWYMPSLDELLILYYNIGPGSQSGNIGNITLEWLWTSTEGPDETAVQVDFNGIPGANSFIPKEHYNYSWVIRSF